MNSILYENYSFPGISPLLNSKILQIFIFVFTISTVPKYSLNIPRTVFDFELKLHRDITNN